jgi:hypothetical protein
MKRKGKSRGKSKSEATANTGVLRCAQDDGEKLATAKTTAKATATATAGATTEGLLVPFAQESG